MQFGVAVLAVHGSRTDCLEINCTCHIIINRVCVWHTELARNSINVLLVIIQNNEVCLGFWKKNVLARRSLFVCATLAQTQVLCKVTMWRAVAYFRRNRAALAHTSVRTTRKYNGKNFHLWPFNLCALCPQESNSSSNSTNKHDIVH